jgi:hypothetical protein
VIAIAFPFFFSSCGKKEAAAPPPAKVKVVDVLQTTVPIPVDFVGQTSGYKDIPIRTRVDGFLTGMYFTEGSTVKRGQLLYTIDPDPLQAIAAAAIPQYVRAVANVENALSILLGRNPGPILRGATLANQVMPPDIPPGLPSDMLQRRPDILAGGADCSFTECYDWCGTGYAVPNLQPYRIIRGGQLPGSP